MSHPRFLVPPLPATGIVSLEKDEARHASQVLRLTAGDPITLFDGQGGEAAGQIESLDKREVRVRILRRTDSNRELSRPLQLIVALPKGDRQRTLVEGLVQLGVTRLVPLRCQRAVAQPTDKALERIARLVSEASKQCGRNRLMEIAAPVSADELAASQGAPGEQRFFAHPYGPQRSLASVPAPVAGQIVVGPEGGFCDEEVASLRAAGWVQIGLGPRILRIEMAAFAVAAWWAAGEPAAQSEF